MIQLADLTLLVAAPSFLKAETIVDGRGRISHWVTGRGQVSADWTRQAPLLSLRMFERMIEEEADRPSRGQYVGAHYMIPHVPWVLNADCSYRSGAEKEGKKKQLSLINMVLQSQCTVRILAAWIDELRRSGHYRDSLILIHSDHGEVSRSRPLLLAKYPGAPDAPLRTDRGHVQLLDLAPTVHEVAGIDHHELPGAPLRVATTMQDREIHVVLSLSRTREPRHISILGGEFHKEYPPVRRTSLSK